MLNVIGVNIIWIFLFTIPILAFGVALSRVFDSMGNFLWMPLLVLSDFISYIIQFLFLGLSGALFLAGLTIAYIRYGGFRELHFHNRFYFLAERPEFTPRWQNVRLAFTKKYPIIIWAILLALSPLFLFVLVRETQYHLTKPLLISHRWVSDKGFTENTAEWILEAKYQGANMVEIDVYEDKDGTLVLSHDPDFKRLARVAKPIYELTNKEISEIFLPNNVKIPTLEEVLKLAKMRDIKLLIEPKIHGHEKNLFEELNKLLIAEDMVGSVMVHSLSMISLETIHKINPHIKTGYIVFGGIGGFDRITNVDFISLQETLATRGNIEAIHAGEKQVFVWTVNDSANVEKYMRLGADGIITDNVPKISEKVNFVLSDSHLRSRTIFRLFGIEFSPDDWNRFWAKIF